MLVETLTRFGPVNLRPIHPKDGGALVRYFERLTPEDVRFRFFGPMRELSPRQVERFTHVDHEREIAQVVEDPETGDLLAVGRLAFDPGGRRAEFAISVRSDLKGRGLGRFVIAHLIERARQRGVEELFGDILEENTTMIAFAKELGFTMTRVPESAAIVRAVYRL
ncbi:MAG TPA: GNAT family N-acetyltransferase [Alphaproteobacteria bacterium]